jgi:hypothetical protein
LSRVYKELACTVRSNTCRARLKSQRYVLCPLQQSLSGMVPLGMKERAHSVIEMMRSYLRFLQCQPGRLGIRAHPWIMRCRIKPKLLNRFADFAFHGGHLIVLLGRNTYASKELCSSGFFCLNPHFLIKIDCCERRRRTSIYYLIKTQEIHAVFGCCSSALNLRRNLSLHHLPEFLLARKMP